MNTSRKLMSVVMVGFTTLVSLNAKADPTVNSVYQCQIDSDDVYVEGQNLPLKYRMRQANVKVVLRANESAKVTIGNGAGQPLIDTRVEGKYYGTSFEKGDLRIVQDTDEFSSYDAEDPLSRISGLFFHGFKPLPHLEGYPQKYRGYFFFVNETLEDWNSKKIIYTETHDTTAICWKYKRR